MGFHVWEFTTICLLLLGAYTAVGCQMTPVCSATSTTVTCNHIDDDGVYSLAEALKNGSSMASSALSVILSFSVISDFPSSIFQGYKVKALRISNSILEEFPHESFFQLDPEMSSLDLGDNTITSVNVDSMKNLPFKNSLTSLFLNGNDISIIAPFAFEQFPNLENLDLSRNRIGVLVGYIFGGLSKLKELKLGGNLISAVDTKAFLKLGALNTLDLGDNMLASLQTGTFTDENLPAIYNLWLPYNVFNCNCDLQWLKDWLSSRDLLENSRATCEQPKFDTFQNTVFCSSFASRRLLASSKSSDFAAELKRAPKRS